jgi:hypothetical protein
LIDSGTNFLCFAKRLLFLMASPLVAAFTPAEKEALSKFKADYLPKALKEAGETTQLEIWGVPMDQESERLDVVIVKFLRAK